MAKILVIDDSKIAQRNISALLAKEGTFSLLFASNGLEGFEVAKNEKPDLILCDLLMPVMDGIFFLEKMREANSNIPVIVVTAERQEGTIKRCLELGARDVINKPIIGVPSNLIETIKKHLPDASSSPESQMDMKSLMVKQALSNSVDRAIETLAPTISLPHTSEAASEAEWLDGSATLLKIAKTWGTSCCAVSLSFESSMRGAAGLVFSAESFNDVSAAISETDAKDSESLALRKDAVSELGNTIANRVIGYLSGQFGIEFKFSPPTYAAVSTGNSSFTQNALQTMIQFGSTISETKIFYIRRKLRIDALQRNVDFICLFEDSASLREVVLFGD